MKSRRHSSDNTISMMVDPSRAPHVVKDLESVRTLKGGSGELDKKHDAQATHISDALGYYVDHKFPIAEVGKWGSSTWGLYAAEFSHRNG